MRSPYTSDLLSSPEAYAIAARAEEQRTANMIAALKVGESFIGHAAKRDLAELILKRLSDKEQSTF